MGVAREDDGDGGASAEVDGGCNRRYDGARDGGEVVLHVDDEENGGVGIWVSESGLEFLVRGN